MKERLCSVGQSVPQMGFVILLILVSLVSAFSQGTKPTLNTRTLVPYAVGEFETISLESGNLMLNFPLASLPPGRGGISANINMVYNSKLLSTANDRFTEIGPTGNPVTWDLQ